MPKGVGLVLKSPRFASSRLQGRDQPRESLLQRLQEQYECALLPDPTAQELQLRGRADPVARMKAALEQQLDVDEHEREVSSHMVPVIIGKGGATIRRLNEQSAAEFGLDRPTGVVSIRGRKLAVQKGVALLDELIEQYGGARDLPIKERQIPLIIGRGGATIKQLQADSGATISVAKEELFVRVRGSRSRASIAAPACAPTAVSFATEFACGLSFATEQSSGLDRSD